MRNPSSSTRNTPSGTGFSRIAGIACRTVLVGFALVLTACTGSNEQRASGIELLVAVNPTQAPTTAGPSCVTSPVTGPGLLVLDTDRLSGNADASQGGRCVFLGLEGAPYSVLTDTNSPQGSRFIVSIPTKGKLQDWPSSLIGPTDLVAPTGVTDFCPTKIAISPAGSLVAALDDPGLADSGCAVSNRPARVVVWQRLTAPGQPLQPAVAFPYSPNGGPIAIALSENTLFVLSPQSPNYILTRYLLNTINNPPTLDKESPSQALPNIPLGNTPTPTQSNLLLNASNLYISFGDSFSGKVYQIASNANVLPADELKINNQPLGIVLNLLSDNKVSDGINQPTFAFVLPDRLKFSRADTISSLLVIVRTVVFTPDGFAWTLSSGGGLSQYDLITLDNLSPTSNAFLNGALNPRDLTWIQRP